MILADSHLHSNFSFDSKESPRNIVERAIHLGLQSICFTDHQDKDYYCDEKEAIVDMEDYVSTILSLQKEYKGKINIRLGIEIGLESHLISYYNTFVKAYPFDFVIGSIHLIDGGDPYFPSFWEHRSDEEAYRDTWQTTLSCITAMHDFDVLGHLDYIVRYGKQKEKTYIYEDSRDIMDDILKTLVQAGKGLEINTASLRAGLSFCHPRIELLKRYRELGGEIVTIGSDAHNANLLAYEFSKAEELLAESGFKYYSEFINREPHFCKIR